MKLLRSYTSEGNKINVYEIDGCIVDVLANDPEEEKEIITDFIHNRDAEKSAGERVFLSSPKLNSPIFVDDKGDLIKPGHWDLTKTPMEWVEDDPE